MLERVSSRNEYDRSHKQQIEFDTQLCQRQLYNGMAYELLQQSHTHCIHIINTHIVSSTSER